MSADRIWIWIADNGNIRKWQHEPFPEGTEYVRRDIVSRDGGWLAEMQARHPLGTEYRIEHDGFEGEVCGYYRRDDGYAGVNLQLAGAKVVHVYGEKWLGADNG